MNKEDLKDLAENPNFIPGIYNYCDRWCERCAFTARCMLFAKEKRRAVDPSAHELNSEAFWETLSETLQTSLEMLQEMAEEQGIDLDSIDVDAEMEEQQRIEDAAMDHECTQAAQSYAERVDAWFDSAEDLFARKQEELQSRARLGIAGDDPHADAAGIEDAVEVIRWYQYQIPIKILDALVSAMKPRPPISEEFLNDSDGSAKVALIAMDRSIAAWDQLYRQFPEAQDEILDLLAHLDRLRKRTEQEFPGARAFVRPGFDEVEP